MVIDVDLYKEILIGILQKEELNVEFKNAHFNIEKAFNEKCFELLNKIKAVIENDSLSDFECIEETVCLFEEYGIGIESRHDFG